MTVTLTSPNLPFYRLRSCLHGGGGPQLAEVTRLGW